MKRWSKTFGMGIFVMNTAAKSFFLFIGSGDRESARSSLKASGVEYIKKMLESGPENWDAINLLLEDPQLVGVL
jgi:hypothetical protein